MKNRKFRLADSTRAEALQIFCAVLGGLCANKNWSDAEPEEIVDRAQRIARLAMGDEDFYIAPVVRDYEAEAELEQEQKQM